MQYRKETGNLILSVSELVSIAYPAGDIGFGKRNGGDVTATMWEKFQSDTSETENLRYRVDLSGEIAIPLNQISEEDPEKQNLPGKPSELVFSLSGTADGIAFSDGSSTSLYLLYPNTAYDSGGRFRQRACARLYLLGYLYCRMSGEKELSLHLAVSTPGASRILYEVRTCTSEVLASYAAELCHAALPVADFLVEHQTEILPKAGEVCFPHPSLRAGQEELIRAVYRAVRQGKRLFVQAPTGIGKTVSTLYPSVKALGNGLCDKIFYLTAKSSTGREAFLASKKLFEAGAHLRTVMVSAKEQVCLLEGKARGDNPCNPFDCPYADGYYERAAGAVLSLLRKQHGYTRQTILETAKEFRVCPYELSLDLSEKCDIVICDYNYVFDPNVYFRRYFGEEAADPGRYVFLIDEAHNLSGRVRDMYSASLSKNRLLKLEEGIPAEERQLKEILDQFLKRFAYLRSLCHDTLQKHPDGSETGFYLSREPVKGFLDAVLSCAGALKNWGKTHRDSPQRYAVEHFLQELKLYQKLAGYYDERFLTTVRVCNFDIEIRIFCLDPSELISEGLNRAKAAVLFSATLTPTDYFIDTLGGGKNAVTLSLPSPFPKENLCLVAVDSVSTRYEDRAASCKKIVSLIAATVSGKAGNYIVYFPSYAYLETVAEAFHKRYPSLPLTVQKRGMGAEEREAFLDTFRDDGKMRIGFCVLGGSFSEGVDLPGKKLIGTVIVGVGLPGLSEEGNILRDYYENQRECGYNYAYTYPGMNRVLQAAGRVIRTDFDRGIVVLIDDRYALPLYKSLFPPHWDGMQYAGNSSDLAKIARDFWENGA